jgi:hypothetical protein
MASKASKAARAGKAAATPPDQPVGPIKKQAPKQGRGAAGKFAAYVPNEKDRVLVALGSMSGGTQERISKIIGISEDTLRKYYASEWDDGRELALLKVLGEVYRVAVSTTASNRDKLMACFGLLNNVGNWKSPKEVSATAEMKSEGLVKFTLKIGERGDDA